jgi:hypothetical protein
MPFRSDRYIPPCIPTRAYKVPAGPDWVHEIKHAANACTSAATTPVERGRGERRRKGSQPLGRAESGEGSWDFVRRLRGELEAPWTMVTVQ